MNTRSEYYFNEQLLQVFSNASSEHIIACLFFMVSGVLAWFFRINGAVSLL